jgi:RecA-family ATPase
MRRGNLAIQLKELYHKVFPPDNRLVSSGLLDYGTLMFIAGPPKTNKSLVVMTMLCQLASGQPLLSVNRRDKWGKEHPVFMVQKPCRILYLEQEVGEQDLHARFHSMLEYRSEVEIEAALDNIYTHSCDRDLRLDTLKGREMIEALVVQHKPDIVVFDPLKEFHYCDENSSKEMGLIFANLDQLRDKYKFASIFIHHTKKPSALSDGDSPDSLRGSSYLFGKGDTFLMLQAKNKAATKISVSFTIRRAKPINSLQLIRNPETLRMEFEKWLIGKDREGDDPESI